MVFKKLFKGLAKTREKLSQGLKGLFTLGRDLDDDFIEELEEVLYTADMGSTAVQVIEDVRAAYKKGEVKSTEDVYEFLKARLREIMGGGNEGGADLRFAEQPPTVILVAGVNGSGKTTPSPSWPVFSRPGGKRWCSGRATPSAPRRWSNSPSGASGSAWSW